MYTAKGEEGRKAVQSSRSNVQDSMSHELYLKGEGMDLEVMQSGSNISFTATAMQGLQQRSYRLFF